jgi:RNA polymerase sigma factor (sigma-70 family)
MQGDEHSFAALQKRFAGGILKFFMQRTSGRADLAEELAHGTWVSVWKALSSGRYDPSRARISTFIYAVATKAHLQFLRDRRRAEGRQASLIEHGLTDREFPDAAGETGLAELIEAVRRCLAQEGPGSILTPEERDLVTAAVRGETDRAAAKRLGIASSTVNTRRRSAYDKIRRYLASQGHRGETGERPAGTGG